MIIIEENTTATIKMYLRDFTTELFNLEIISEDQRKQVVDVTISGTWDDFRKVLTFTYDVSALVAESFYVIKICEPITDVATYQPKLATTEKTMNNEFKIYGE